MIKKVLLSLLLVGIIVTQDLSAMKRARSAPAQVTIQVTIKKEKDDTENKKPTKKQKREKQKRVEKDEKEGKAACETAELQDAVLNDDIAKFKELVGIQPSIDSAITVGGRASTLLHAVVYAYALKGISCAGKPPVYCQDSELDENKLIEWFMLLIYFNVDFNAKDGKGKTAAQLATKQYLKSNAWCSNAMKPEERAFVAVLKKIPELMSEAIERYVSLTAKQRPDDELREYFGLVKIKDFIKKFIPEDVA